MEMVRGVGGPRDNRQRTPATTIRGMWYETSGTEIGSEWWINAVSATEAIFTAITCHCFKQSQALHKTPLSRNLKSLLV